LQYRSYGAFSASEILIPTAYAVGYKDAVPTALTFLPVDQPLQLIALSSQCSERFFEVIG
jgi:hypothetical protein